MATEDLNALAPRLVKLAAYLRKHVSIDYSVWITPDGRVRNSEWSVWDGEDHHKGRTAEAALDAAEIQHGLNGEIPSLNLSIITPDSEEDGL